MPVENQDEFTDQDADDVFDKMANTLDADNEDGEPADLADDNNEDEDESEQEQEANAPETTDADDVFEFDKLLPAAQRVFQDLEHRSKSDSGRVSSLQKQIDAQAQQLADLQAQGKGDTKAAQKLEDDIDASEAKLDGLLEDLPELAGFVEQFKSMKAENSKLRSDIDGVRNTVQEQVLAPAQQRAAQESEQREIAELKKVHPDYFEVAASPKFDSWLEGQPDSIKKIADSNDSREVSALLTFYKNSNPSPSATITKKKVQRSIDDLTVIPRDGNARSTSVSGDQDALFNHFADMADKGKL